MTSEQDTNRRKTILMISMTRTASDVRIMRHISQLVEKYDFVTIGYGESPPNVIQHVEIPKDVSYLPISLGSVIPHLFRLFKVSSKKTPAVHFVQEQLDSISFDLLWLNDVQTLPLLENLHCSVLVDMHEYAPLEMEDDWRFRVFLMRYYKWLCSRYLQRASRVVTVSNGLADAYQKNFSVDCLTVLNAREERDLPVHRFSTGPIRLVHSGLAAKARKLEVMIHAVSGQPNLLLDMYLVEAPRQPQTLKRLKRLASQTSNVRICESVPSSTLPDVINKYDLSLAYIAPANFSLRFCMPNKLFDSIQARVGVISGPSIDMADLCQKERIGLSTSQFDATELRTMLLSLTAEEINTMKLSSNLCAAKITARSEAKKLEETIEEILSDEPSF